MFKTKEEKDDNDWFEVLAGREPTKDADLNTVKEAKLIREAWLDLQAKDIIKNYIGDTDGTDNLGDC
tara:strand:+ start:558 stop:758 length:201 start_codon:yes stop_codon:yes gene_type:complete